MAMEQKSPCDTLKTCSKTRSDRVSFALLRKMSSKKRFGLLSLIVVAAMLATMVVGMTAGLAPTTVYLPAVQKGEATPCESLVNVAMAWDVTITLAEEVPAGTEFEERGRTIVVEEPFCRVHAVGDPAINIEVVMPLAENWNGRYLGTGGGGMAGELSVGGLVGNVAEGYASSGTDCGHVSEGMGPQNTEAWLDDRPDLWVDFGYKAMHVTADTAKKLITAYYGEGPEYSYYVGGSGGGGQAFMLATRYPADFDGIAAGAPAMNQSRGWPQEMYPAFLNNRGPEYDVSDKLEMVHAAVLDACDADDGVVDEVIRDPLACDFDPASLLCEGEEAEDCLTAAEVDTIQKIYDGIIDPTTGEQWYPGDTIGSEFTVAGHVASAHGTSVAWFKWIVFDDPDWDWTTFDYFDPDDFAAMKFADDAYGPIYSVDTNTADLTAFKELGGKMILAHGWWDANIIPINSINFYEHTVEVVGSLEETQEFFRLFMMPGCGHGPGVGPSEYDNLAIIQAWVETGVAPDQIIASKSEEGVVTMTRPLCPYPQVAIYKGTGDTNDAANFYCGNPE